MALCAAALPLEAALLPLAGFLDLASLGLPDSPSIELTMGRPQLDLMAAQAAGDPNTAALLAGLHAVQLRQYAAPDARTVAAAEALPDSLEGAGWELARQQTAGSRTVYLYVRKSAAGVTEGLTLLVIDAQKLVAIANVAGDLPPAQLGQLGLPISP